MSEPSWPVFMAWSMSSASGPRHSPTTIRSGRMRRAFFTRSRIVYSPAPSMLAALGFQPHDVLLGELQLGRVLDRDDPLLVGNEIAEAVEQRGFAGAGTAGNEDVACGRARSARRNSAHGARHRALGDEVVDDHFPLGELADRERRPAHGERRDDRVHAAAVGEAGIHERLRAIDAAADVGDDPLDDRLDHGVGDEAAAGVLQVAVALDVNVRAYRRP